MKAALVPDRAVALAQSHGFNATTFQTLRGGFERRFLAEACVAYVDTGRAWVAAGAPISPEASLAAAAEDFASAARAAGRRACFFGTEERFVSAAARGFESVQVGEQPVWRPAAWSAGLAAHKSLREQLRRARAKGVTVRRLAPGEADQEPVRSRLQSVRARWLSARPLAPMGFLVGGGSDPLPARRVITAARAGEIVAFVELIPVPARSGWMVESLVRGDTAPNGTSELLVDAAMRWATEMRSDWLTLGLAPLAGAVPTWMRVVGGAGASLYDFDGLRRFKAKLGPAAWDPIYVSWPRGSSSIVPVVDVLRAFAGGSLIAFAAWSLARRWLRAATALARKAHGSASLSW